MKNELISKCDVIIPIYNAPEWVKLCVYSLMINTDKKFLGKIFLMNDNSDETTSNCIQNLKKKYGDVIEIITNKQNLGFIKNVNKGLKETKGKYVLLLNSDCLVSKNTIEKLIHHMNADNKVGLVSPISNNAANVSLEIPEGFSYTQIDSILGEKFLGKSFDACTIVGNCLMISRECFLKTGYLDESYGMGYGEETDYQFKAMQKGFKAKIAIDTYVFHKAEASFGNSPQKQKRVESNRKLFFERWGNEYFKLSKEYGKNDPIEYVKNNLDESCWEPNIDSLFFLPQITQNSGGCHAVIDMVNYLIINGFNANILYEEIYDYKEIMLFTPLRWTAQNHFKARQILSTIWISTFRIFKLVEKLRIPLINYVQGYESYFENGAVYNSVSLTYKMADDLLTISQYLAKKIKKNFGYSLTVVTNGVNVDLYHKENIKLKPKSITFVIRENVMKGDYLVPEIISRLDNIFKGLDINLIFMSEYREIPSIKNNNLESIQGPLSRLEVLNILRDTDIYVDTSVNEGFGLLGLEAMSCGAVPIMSNSFGIDEYLKDNINGLLIKEVNNCDKYFEIISRVINNPEEWRRLKNEGSKTDNIFDYDKKIPEYISFLRKKREYKKKKYTTNERELLSERSYLPLDFKPKGLSIVEIVNKLIPIPVRNILKKIISWLYSLYD